jgi:hypothetical protein
MTEGGFQADDFTVTGGKFNFRQILSNRGMSTSILELYKPL